MYRPLRSMIEALVLVALVVPAACGREVVSAPGDSQVGEARATVQEGREFELEMGRTAVIRGRDVRITLREVPEDSRCPMEVVCVWQGNAVALLEVGRGVGGEVTSVRLNTGVTPTDTLVHGVRLRLVGVLPAARDGVRIPQEGYSVVLVVEG